MPCTPEIREGRFPATIPSLNSELTCREAGSFWSVINSSQDACKHADRSMDMQVNMFRRLSNPSVYLTTCMRVSTKMPLTLCVLALRFGCFSNIYPLVPAPLHNLFSHLPLTTLQPQHCSSTPILIFHTWKNTLRYVAARSNVACLSVDSHCCEYCR